jgi:arginine decarboxylase
MSALPRIETLPLPFTAAPALPAGYEVADGRLFYRGLDVLALVERPVFVNGRLERPATPLYVRRLSALRENYEYLRAVFAAAKAQVGYPRDMLIAYASKANPSAPVVKTVLQAGAAYECSSAFDVDVVRHAAANGWLDRSRPILANGFKIPRYANTLLRLRADGFENIMPIFDDLEELELFAAAGLPFEVGLRARTLSDQPNRFGMDSETLRYAAERLAALPHLRLTTYHAMQTVSAARGLGYQNGLIYSLRGYAALWRVAPTLHRFNFGGGLPARYSGMNFEAWMRQTLGTIMAVCAEEGVPVPDLIFETGRYMVQDHAMRLFKVVKTRMGSDGVPYYMIDGSIMSSFPDAWALGETFTVLPVNNWEGEFVQARLAGLTCDHDDVYPTRRMDSKPLLLPAKADGLIVGFFECGAYQETLGGRRGAHHCLLPEGGELILDVDAHGVPVLSYADGQDAPAMLGTLGYG